MDSDSRRGEHCSVHPIHQCRLWRALALRILLFGWGVCRAGRPGLFSLLTIPPSIPSPLPLGKLKSELDMMVGKCPEDPLEGDMSSPNSTGTQVREGQGFPPGPERNKPCRTNDPKGCLSYPRITCWGCWMGGRTWKERRSLSLSLCMRQTAAGMVAARSSIPRSSWCT